ncbi:hypothetical protein TrRE_jg3448, partial [Triparma retinervis]
MASKSTPSIPLPASPMTNLLDLNASVDSLNVPTDGLDKSMKLLGYTCSLLSNALNLSPSLSLASSSFPSLSDGLQSVSNEMSTARYAMRLCSGLPSSLQACRTNGWAWGDLDVEEHLEEGDPDRGSYPYTDRAPRAVDLVERTLPWSMMAYYPLEHLAYAGWNMKGMIWDSAGTGRGGLRDRSRWPSANVLSAVSCWAWLWYIVGDIVVQAERVYRIGMALKKLEGREGKEGPRENLRRALRTHGVMLAREALFLLPGVHWSRLDWAEK